MNPQQRSIQGSQVGFALDGMIALMWIALSIYAILLPWQFNLDALIPPDATAQQILYAAVTAPQWDFQFNPTVSAYGVPEYVSDIATNFLLFVPAAVLIRWWLYRHGVSGRWGLLRASLIVAILFGTVSWACEAAQAMMVWRVSSAWDVLLNTGGAMIGAVVALPVWHLWRVLIFRSYCRIQPWIKPRVLALRAMVKQPAIRWVMIGSYAMVLGFWLWTSAMTGTASDAQTVAHDPAWHLPLLSHVALPYDQALVELGQSLLVWVLVLSLGAMVSLPTDQRRALRWMVLVVALLAGLRVVLGAMLGPGGWDMTELLLGVLAFGGLWAMVQMTHGAVRCSCRRRQQVPVAFDRRRAAHEYALTQA